MAGLLCATLGSETPLELAADAALWLVEADPIQLESAILSLIINARDAMPHGGQVTIAMRDVPAAAMPQNPEIEPGDHVAIHVTDTGAGMSVTVREAAFEPFFTTKPAGQGSGLGLSQIYGFIKQSCGHVALDSEPGVGTP